MREKECPQCSLAIGLRAALIASLAAVFLIAPATLGRNRARHCSKISSPASGIVVNPGQTFTVTVTSPANATFQTVAVIGEDPVGSAGPGEFRPGAILVNHSDEHKFPDELQLNRSRCHTLLNQLAESNPILIDVQRPDMPTAISQVDHPTPGLIFRAIGQQLPILLLATFSDGSMIEVTRSCMLHTLHQTRALPPLMRTEW